MCGVRSASTVLAFKQVFYWRPAFFRQCTQVDERRMKRFAARGQALAEFALIIIAVLMLIFLILEAGRVLWAWVTVQGAARDGARYAITGRDGCEAGMDRLDCVVDTTLSGLSGLPLNQDPDALFEDDHYFLIEVFGVNENGELVSDFAGAPGQPVVVRVIYRVPIVTPFFRPIRPSLPVFGQVTMNNEQWGNLGGATAGVGLPPPLPDIPTPGVTPSPTATPTPGASPTPTASSTPTSTPTATRCATQFETVLVHGDEYVGVTGQLNSGVSLFDMSVTGTPGVPLHIGSAALINRDGHACPGYADAHVGPPLESGHTIMVRNDAPDDGSYDIAVVITATPTPTLAPTETTAPTATPTNTATPLPTATPVGPYLALFPACGFGPTVTITVQGHQFSSGTINLFWKEGSNPLAFQGTANGPNFTQVWTMYNVSDGVHQIRAIQGNTNVGVNFQLPCPNMPTPTPETTATPTLAPADLVITGPVLLSTPPIVEYRPLQFQFVIANEGDVDVETQFFNDLFIDPPGGSITEQGIDIVHTDGYIASGSLAAGATRVIIIESPLGFTGGIQGTRTVYGMVDSVRQVDEADETNNLTAPLNINGVTPAPSPTPSATPGGDDVIMGQVMAYIGNWAPQRRADVWLVNSGSGQVVAGPVATAHDGRYVMNGVPAGTYNLFACIEVDQLVYVGSRPGVLAGDPFADIFMVHNPLGCPY